MDYLNFLWGPLKSFVSLLAAGDFLKILGSVMIGYVSNIFFQKWMEKSRMRHLKDFIIYWSYQIYDPISTQLESFDEFIEELQHKEGLDGINLKSYALNIEEILNIDESDKVKAFVLSSRKYDDIDKSETYFEFNSGLRGLKLAKVNFSEFHTRLINIMSEIQDEWNNTLRTLHEVKHEVIAPYAHNLKENEFAFNVNLAFNKWYAIPNKTPKITYDNLINPLDQYCQDEYKKDPANENIHKLASQIQDLKTVYNKFTTNRDLMVESFSQIRDNFNSSFQKINYALPILEGLKFKNILFISPSK